MRGKVRIVSDGTPFGTHVYAVDKDGVEVEVVGVVAVDWRGDCTRLAEAVISLTCVEADAIGGQA